MLKAVVEDVRIYLEALLGNSSGAIAVRGNHDGHAGQAASQQRRLVAYNARIRRPPARRLDDDQVCAALATVTSRQNGGLPSSGDEELGQVLDEGCLARSADGQVPDTDDGLAEVARGEPLAPVGSAAAGDAGPKNPRRGSQKPAHFAWPPPTAACAALPDSSHA